MQNNDDIGPDDNPYAVTFMEEDVFRNPHEAKYHLAIRFYQRSSVMLCVWGMYFLFWGCVLPILLQEKIERTLLFRQLIIRYVLLMLLLLLVMRSIYLVIRVLGSMHYNFFLILLMAVIAVCPLATIPVLLLARHLDCRYLRRNQFRVGFYRVESLENED
ncbi:MAG: hypothetical protein LBQ54_07075 [Planctomycetaceae bacterium]|nr:hypothetical protein [Planctomycetaceae bacterium]